MNSPPSLMNIAADSPTLSALARIPSGSNTVYLCADEQGDKWVHKPVLGERPLADFPDGTLAGRELAAYVISEALGWELVPHTVIANGPGGIGMAQRWIEESPDDTSAPVQAHAVEHVPDNHVAVMSGIDHTGAEVVLSHATGPLVRRIALFDLVINNADRKGGHVLTAIDGRVWAIDHGLCFHSCPKLRTVLWGWLGQSLTAEEITDLVKLRGYLKGNTSLHQKLVEVLSTEEIDALDHRLSALIAVPRFPSPDSRYPLPWPLF